jgi:hypothetical protein
LPLHAKTLLSALAIGSCAATQPAAAPKTAVTAEWPHLDSNGLVRTPSPTGASIVSGNEHRYAIYDDAMAALYLVHRGRRDDAARVLTALSAVQHADGSLPFSFADGEGARVPYVRSGAMAWVGYAAAMYLDAARDGANREAVARMAHRIAGYLLAHQVERPGDPRDGLVLGGEGRLTIERRAGKYVQVFEPADIAWASTEHNIDAFFFLRRLARVTESARYAASAERIRSSLLARAWNPDAGQFHRGLSDAGPDASHSLDCASWGALFLLAAGDPRRAETAAAIADARYATVDPRSGARGHKPYVHAPLAATEEMARELGLSVTNWDDLDAPWAEGSAGVALAAFRSGHRARAKAILADLAPLRDREGALPTLTTVIPFEFDTEPSIAATAWSEIVSSEIAGDRPWLWVP